MDFCHPCQRHLNGALACPGCGAPAQSVPVHAAAPVAPTYAGAVAAPYGQQTFTQTPARPYDDREGPYDGDLHEDHDGQDVHEDHDGHDPSGGGEDPDEPRGRSARRDRKAAAHRRRRRRLLLVGAGFVLAAGGLSLAELGTDAPFSPFSGDSPAVTRDATVDGGASASPDRTAAPLDAPSGAAGKPGASASADASASASASESPKDKASKSPSATGETARPATAGAGSTASAPAPPAPSQPASTPTSAPTTSQPTPQPSPTRTCNRFLWWCT
ncbi:SCO2400 family protein [Streptomyces collinus]|uniref:SCO2400 family protein n=1 Tax=Streptomyces collinus TaxID=42684 RepID=UPI00331E0F09